MLEEYDIQNLNPRKNPYAEQLRKQLTITLDADVAEYFKKQSLDAGLPYQTLINLYLRDCMTAGRRLQF